MRSVTEMAMVMVTPVQMETVVSVRAALVVGAAVAVTPT